MPSVLTMGLGLVAVALTGCSAALGTLWQRAERNRRMLASDVGRLSSDLEALSIQIASLNEQSSRLLDQRSDLQDALRAAEERIAAANATSIRVEQEREADRRRMRDLGIAHANLQKGFASMEEAHSQAQEDLAGAEVALEQAMNRAKEHGAVLASLGVEVGPRTVDPLELDRRARSREAVHELLVDCGGTAAALVSTEGLPYVGSGQDAGVDRLSVVGGWFMDTIGAWEAALDAPATHFSLLDRRLCAHYARLPGRRGLLGVENLGDAPRFAMNHAMIRLVDRPGAPTGKPASLPTSLDLDHALDERMSARLTEWSKRRGALSVTVVDETDQVHAVSASGRSGTAGNLVHRLRPLFHRVALHGRAPDDLVWVARAADGTCVVARLVEPETDGAVVVVVSRSLPSEEAIDELCATVRWTMARPEPREAS
ncbi:MAG: hypothetical protein EP330_22355 [Deltaproteobacteria bacterium]|nr:MAG: hypothetical protein EP330_22355 [Deltaproteobacteria bacterium]